MNRTAKDALLLVCLVCLTLIFSIPSTRFFAAAQAASSDTPEPTPNMVRGRVWHDLNADGRQDDNEPGIGGVVVQLWNSSMTQMLQETLTDGAGVYVFYTPDQGEYRIRVLPPRFGDQFSPKQSAQDDLRDSHVNADMMRSDAGFSDPFELGEFPVLAVIGMDAGIVRNVVLTPTGTPVRVGDLVWNDLNENGLQDDDEPGLEGIIVQLWDSDKTQLLYETITDELGRYTLVAYAPGMYRVRVVEPNGASFSLKDVDENRHDSLDSDIHPELPDIHYGYTDVINLPTGAVCALSIDAGLIRVPPAPTPTAALSDTPSPTSALPPTATIDWSIPCVEPEGTSISGSIMVTDTPQPTGSSGDAPNDTPAPTSTSTSLPADTPLPTSTMLPEETPLDMSVPSATATPTLTPTITLSPTETLTPSATLTPTDTITPTISLTPTDTPTNLPPGVTLTPSNTPTRTPTPINLGNFVWDDIDHDGRQDAGEPGLPNITVQLWNSAKTLLIEQTTTNASGIYSLTAPLPGDYRIRVLLPPGDSFSPKDQAGGDNNQDSDVNPTGGDAGFTDVISIANNVISMTNIDAGVIVYRTPTPTRTPTPINLGNFVWDDIDHDGRQDAGEPGLPNITVQLWNSAKTLLIEQTTTNASGIYSLTAPLPGDYRIRVLLPGAYDSFSPKDQAGGDNTQDSDVNPIGVHAGFTDVISIANNVISMTNIDAGVIVYRTPTPTRTPTPINLGNLVWDDLDYDGRQDAGEPGLPNITVQLWNSAKTLLIEQTTTNASGIYSLTAPLPGDYRIRVLLPGAYDSFSPKDQAGGDDTQDSDVNPIGVHAGFTDVISIANNVISMSNIDIGIITPTVLPPLPTAIILPLVTTPTPLVNQLPPPPQPTSIPRVDPNLCSGFRLTSPLDGLPNGFTTFYWDPISASNASYRIMVFDEGRNLLATFEAGSSTNVSGNVSQPAIGGAFQLVIQVSAIVNNRVACTDERTILREASPSGEQPPVVRPTDQRLPPPTNPPPPPTPTLPRRVN